MHLVQALEALRYSDFTWLLTAALMHCRTCECTQPRAECAERLTKQVLTSSAALTVLHQGMLSRLILRDGPANGVGRQQQSNSVRKRELRRVL